MDPTRPDPPGAEDERFDTDFAVALGRAIKVFRTGVGMGRRDLADTAGLSYSYVTEIENGKKQASAGAQQAIAAALGLSASQLLAAAEEWAAQLRGGAGLERAYAFDESPMDAPTSMRRSPATHGIAEARAPEHGARHRQLRWFQSAARQAHVAQRGAVFAQAPEVRVEETTVQEALEQLARLLAEMEPGDRQRVVDLARRLARR